MVTCHAGKVSVFRATGASELRPYQRALSGAGARENIQVLCDGTEYKAEEHITIGFGETSPTAGRTVQQFLSDCGVSELASDGLLRSLGLEGIIGKACSELSPDQEARLRLIAATCDPDKALILNDPFEQISHQWRERAAELLANYARSRKALIIIPCLSYRPESWIDNQVVERIEVGQTSQRTIGFGSANSQHNEMIKDLRDKLRADPRFGDNSPGKTTATVGAAMAGITAGIPVEAGTSTTRVASSSKSKSLLKVFSLLVGAGVGGWFALSWSNKLPVQSTNPQPSATSVASLKPPPSVAPVAPAPTAAKAPEADPNSVKAEAALVAHRSNQPPSKSEEFVLDLYPPAIKASILDSVKGIDNEPVTKNSNAPAPAPKDKEKSGNLFSLLEQASSATAPAGSQPSSYGRAPAVEDAVEDSGPVDVSAEEQRRQEIRERFLEAIRRSAEERATERAEYTSGE